MSLVTNAALVSLSTLLLAASPALGQTPIVAPSAASPSENPPSSRAEPTPLPLPAGGGRGGAS